MNWEVKESGLKIETQPFKNFKHCFEISFTGFASRNTFARVHKRQFPAYIPWIKLENLNSDQLTVDFLAYSLVEAQNFDPGGKKPHFMKFYTTENLKFPLIFFIFLISTF